MTSQYHYGIYSQNRAAERHILHFYVFGNVFYVFSPYFLVNIVAYSVYSVYSPQEHHILGAAHDHNVRPTRPFYQCNAINSETFGNIWK